MERDWFRRGVQSIVSIGLATVVGRWISGDRWYWAALIAFIVSVGAQSREEVLIKGLQRLAGTVLGVIAGMAIATIAYGHLAIEAPVLLVAIFLAYYSAQAAYGVMSFFITLMIALAFGMLGRPPAHLLVLRLEETAAGALIAAAVTVTVLPVRESKVFKAAAEGFLAALSKTVACAGADDPEAAEGALSDLRLKAQALRQAVPGFKRGWTALVQPRYRRATRAALRCAYVAREHLKGGGREDLEPVRDRIESLRAWLSGEGEPPNVSESPAESPLANAVTRFAWRLRDAI